MMNAKQIKEWLEMQPNKVEGGFFANVYNSTIEIGNKDLPGFKPIKDKRVICGVIYYFLDTSGCSYLHRVTGDMVYHFYSGDPVQMLLLYQEGHPNRSEICVFSNNLAAGGHPAKFIPAGTWLGTRLIPGGEYALMGVTLAPGFNPADYELGDRKALIKQYPGQKDMIEALTRK